jgi:peptidoglycan/LPS O-acetylase OafA/YrhL
VQIVLGILIGALVGLAVHYVLRDRRTRGVALAPIIGAAVAAVVWTALTWAGLGIDNPLLWLAALAVPAIVTVPAILVLSAARARRDALERERLQIG